MDMKSLLLFFPVGPIYILYKILIVDWLYRSILLHEIGKVYCLILAHIGSRLWLRFGISPDKFD